MLVAACGSSSSPSPSASAAASGATPASAAPQASAAPSTGTTTQGGGASAASASPGGQTGSSFAPAPSGPLPSLAPLPSSAALQGAISLQQRFVEVVKAVSPSVVVIATSTGLGSGIVFDDRGDIVTNAHVTGNASRFTVTFADGRSVPGTLVGTFLPNDLAVVHVNAGDLHPASFGDSSKLAVGDIVMAVGNPLGFQSSVTEGIVSALGRTVTEPTGAVLPGTIQTSAAINPGNSGGALVNLEGQVVGIPTLAAVDQQIGGSAPGIGFAIPSNTARNIASQLIQYGKVVNSGRAYLGIEAANVLSSPGVLVYSVVAGGPAANAGIKAGELITAIDGQKTPDANTLAIVLAGLKPGQKVRVDLLTSAGTATSVGVTLGQYPG